MKASVWRRKDFLSEDLKEVRELAEKIFGRRTGEKLRQLHLWLSNAWHSTEGPYGQWGRVQHSHDPPLALSIQR